MIRIFPPSVKLSVVLSLSAVIVHRYGAYYISLTARLPIRVLFFTSL